MMKNSFLFSLLFYLLALGFAGAQICQQDANRIDVVIIPHAAFQKKNSIFFIFLWN